jgi:hypothetical protein
MQPLRSVNDLILEASAAEDPATAERCLARAADQASSIGEWEALLEASSPELPAQRLRAFAEQALAWAEEREVAWVYQHVAAFQAYKLEEPGAARETLSRAERMLAGRHQGGRALGFEWGVIAEAYALCGLEREAVLRCLNTGWEVAWAEADVENLGRLTKQWAHLVGRSEAVARWRRVEEAALAWDGLKGTIYWWHALDEPEEGRRVRQLVLERATHSEEVLELVRYWDLYEKDSPGLDTALARAESLARTPSDWFGLASEALLYDRQLSRRALDRAAALPMEERLRVQVAEAYVAWFDDEAAAERLGPRGLRPEELRAPQVKLNGWEASASELFDWLRTRVSPAALAHIARADYGTSADKHLSALQWICGSGRVPVRLPWWPGEVVALTRWKKGEEVDHVGRALCCVLLLLASPEDDLFDTGPVLVESCLALGTEACARGEHFLAWFHECADQEAGEAAAALFLMLLLRASHAPDDARLEGLIRHMSQLDGVRGLRSGMAGSLRVELWERLIEARLGPLHRRRPALSAGLQALGFAP